MSIGIDVAQARRLADLISESVSRLEDADADADSTNKARCGCEQRDLEVQTIVSAATQLAALVRPPAQVLLEVATGFTLSAALRLVVEANVPEIIRALTCSLTPAPSADDSGVGLLEAENENKVKVKAEVGERDAEGVAIGDISRLCDVEARKLERILRLLATHHIFVERPAVASRNPAKESGVRGGLGTYDDEGEARFANNRLSAALDSGVPLEDLLPSQEDLESLSPESRLSGTRKRCWAVKYGAEAPGAGLAALVGILTDESMFHMIALTEVLLGTAPDAPSHPPSVNLSKGEGKETETNENKNGNENENEKTLGLKYDCDSESPYLAPFSCARSLPHTTMFEWLGLPANAHRLHRFGCAMRGMNALGSEGAILKGFDFSALPPGSVVIDVGGGVGAASLPVLRANAHLRLVVQDTQEVVRVAPGFWERHYPSALHSGRVKFEVQDFFEAQPDPQDYFRVLPEIEIESDTTGRGGKLAVYVYLLRMIAHNWSDSHCLRILERLRCAVGEEKGKEKGRGRGETKLVLVDSVLMPACRSRSRSEDCKDREFSMDVDAGMREETHDRTGPKEIKKSMTKIREAPEPLLPNWGIANALAYKFDLIMLANHNALERTLPHFHSLLSRAGWEIVEVHTQDGGEAGAGAGAGESWMAQIVAVPAI